MGTTQIFLGQAAVPTRLTPAVPAQTPSRSSVISRQEGEMVVRIVASIVAFTKSFPLEFYAYCPPDRWKPVLEKVAPGVADIEKQLAAGAKQIYVSADVLFAVTDLEECVSGSRDARLSSAKTAMFISAGAAIGETLFGLSWLGLPAYIISLAIVLGRPLVERAKEVPAEPFRVDSMGSSKDCIRLGDHTDKAKLIERVIVTRGVPIERHYWGSVQAGSSGVIGCVCLTKGKFRVRVEGWVDDIVTPADGWSFAPDSMCSSARNEIAVWTSCGSEPRDTGFPPVPTDSGHEKTIWVEYTGPLTEGTCRVAGPFG
jgi:hypothetical protein